MFLAFDISGTLFKHIFERYDIEFQRHCKKTQRRLDEFRYASPAFVEWLMGMKTGLTDVRPMKCRKDM